MSNPESAREIEVAAEYDGTRLEATANGHPGLLAGSPRTRLVDSAVTDNDVFRNTQDGIVFQGVDVSTVSGNRVERNGRDGVVLDDSSKVQVSDNEVSRNGRDGIHVTNGSSDNTITRNDLERNGRFDAYDDTTGAGTAGTANTWRDNQIGTANRPGLR